MLPSSLHIEYLTRFMQIVVDLDQNFGAECIGGHSRPGRDPYLRAQAQTLRAFIHPRLAPSAIPDLAGGQLGYASATAHDARSRRRTCIDGNS
jgi:hypothetical protein